MKIKDIEFDGKTLDSCHFNRTIYNSVTKGKCITWHLELDFKIADDFNFIYEHSIGLDYTEFDFENDIDQLDNYISYLRAKLNKIINQNAKSFKERMKKL